MYTLIYTVTHTHTVGNIYIWYSQAHKHTMWWRNQINPAQKTWKCLHVARGSTCRIWFLCCSVHWKNNVRCPPLVYRRIWDRKLCDPRWKWHHRWPFSHQCSYYTSHVECKFSSRACSWPADVQTRQWRKICRSEDLYLNNLFSNQVIRLLILSLFII